MIDVSKCTRYCADNGKCTAFKGQYLCSERKNCYTKRLIAKQEIIDKLNGKLQQALEENERYKEEIMILRQGYDEESCIETCPHSQKQEQEIEQLEQKLAGHKRMQSECNIANRKLREIKEQIKIFWKAGKADDSFAAIEKIEKI